MANDSVGVYGELREGGIQGVSWLGNEELREKNFVEYTHTHTHTSTTIFTTYGGVMSQS